MTTDKNGMDLDLLEKSIVETALPAHMMYLATQALITEKFIMRADIVKALNNGAASPFNALSKHPKRVSSAAARTDSVAQSALNRLNPNQTMHALYVSAMLAVVLVDEGLYADVDNVAVTTALVLLEDLKSEGHVEDYRFKETRLRGDANYVLHHIKKEGLYSVSAGSPLLIGS